MAFDRTPPRDDAPEELTLDDALRQAATYRWRGQRSATTTISGAELAVVDLKARYGYGLRVSRVTRPMLRALVQEWQRPAADRPPLSPATINRRLSALSAMGVSVKGCRPRPDRKPKWWLAPDAQATLTAELRKRAAAEPMVFTWSAPLDPEAPAPTMRETGIVFEVGRFRFPMMEWSAPPPPPDPALALSYPLPEIAADFVDFTVFTGLRVEESLRLTIRSFTRNAKGLMALTVPGTKTARAEATLPLGSEAQAFAEKLLVRAKVRWEAGEGDRIFPVDYRTLREYWTKHCRPILGVEHEPLATLKALRRSAARHLHAQKGMPLDVLRQYLRHENVMTTMGYLRLTGGYGEDEMRQWLA